MKRLPVEDLEHILKNTEDVWESLRGKSIFITGGTGFFGKWLLFSLLYINEKLNLNISVLVLTRNGNAFLKLFPELLNQSNLRFYEGDICNFDFPSEQIHYIIHAATEASVKLNLESPLVMFDTIVNGTKRVLDLAVEKRVEGFLFTSSGAIYGNQPLNISHMFEEYKGGPNISDSKSIYGEGKRIAEVLCSIYFDKHNINVKVARCFAFIGPYLPLKSNFVAGNFIYNILSNEEVIIKGNVDTKRSYLYASDMAIWLWNILIKGKSNFPYNVGSDFDISIQNLAKTMISESKSQNLKYRLQENSENLSIYVPSVERAKLDLNLEVCVDLKLAITKTLKFYS